ncbi:hypothetical protein GOP47_0030225, partial [Adiantum capillus-veneris]
DYLWKLAQLAVLLEVRYPMELEQVELGYLERTEKSEKFSEKSHPPEKRK